MLSCSFQTVITSEIDKERHVTFCHLPEKKMEFSKEVARPALHCCEKRLGLLKKLQNVFVHSKHCLERL